MSIFRDALLDMEGYKKILKSVEENITPINISGVSESQKAHLIYSLCMHTSNQPVIVVTYNEAQAERLYEDMRFFIGDRVKLFPKREYIFYDVEAYSTDYVQQRLSVLETLYLNPSETVVITTIDAFIQFAMPYETYRKYRTEICVGTRYELQKLIDDFTLMGYERVDMVEGKGQFSLRGGIIDYFPVITDQAYRVEFFDDEVDSIRVLDIDTQRSVEKLREVTLSPAREIIFSKEDARNISDKMDRVLKDLEEKATTSLSKEILKTTIEHIRADIEKINQQHYFPAIDRYLTIIYREIPTLIDQLNSSNAMLFLDEPARIKERCKAAEFEFAQVVESMMEKGLALSQTSNLILNYNDFLKKLTSRKFIGLSALSSSNVGYSPLHIENIASRTLHSFNGRMEFLIDDLMSWKNKGYRVVILAGSQKRAKELVVQLEHSRLNSVYFEDINSEVANGQIAIFEGSLNKGFEYPEIKLSIVSDKEIFKHKIKKKELRTRKTKDTIKTFAELTVGDYVVHQSHGIGMYVGIDKLTVDGITKDYIKLKYHGADFLYVPANQLDLVQKYIGAEGRTPRLNKLGGTEWTKTKLRVKQSVADLARDLVKLYAARRTIKGFQFPPDTVWQNQFEENFPYEETSDQLRCIEEVKRDMEKPIAMERLLCGDVGYGKTEVAIRAAFKAVMGGKQVAYLVPTTILAQQHYNNFVQRMENFAANVEMLSRFRSAGEQKKILKKVKTGEIDIIVGTHRILSKDIQFKDLGLLIIDEEQRFGVTHKEKMKKIRENIDVLTLTATPIPRTLHMSMTGIRDMSLLEEPPEDRYPVQTYVMEYNSSLIRDAIVSEVGRGGQVYYLHNRVDSIYKVSESVRNMAPEARIAVAHGKMDERELEDIMMSVINGEVDVLVCTTIIESGLDISNVNTIIIEDADRMGLSQLYQLRGRVGRSNRHAHAYITYRKDKVINEDAEKRLKAIKEFTEFGSGFKIAMRDLEIRGAGNLLGSEQHGHMSSVGYDMYLKLLREAVTELKGDVVEKEIETAVDLDVNAYIPQVYIVNPEQRIQIYKKIASIKDADDLFDIEEEIEDRFGDLPESVLNLTSIALIKSYANDLKICGVQQKLNRIILSFDSTANISPEAIFKLVNASNGQIIFTASEKPYLTLKILNKDYNAKSKSGLLNNIKILLQNMKELQIE